MDNTGLTNIAFDMPKNQSNVIKVIGVGGGGSNAINHMFQQGIKGVDFVICNTDAQALENSPIPNKIQLGVSLTEGLGAGANPEIGEQAAIESYEDIKNMLGVNTKMVFITAGMGGGTGTGAAPVIAKMAKEMEILTVAIVTAPFKFEGRMRDQQAQIGIEKLRSQVDSLIVINNNKLREVYGNLGFKAGFSKADEVLATASRGIAEVITHHYTQNIDLRDAKTVLSNSGTAIMGSANASGANRAQDAITKALDSPLLNDNKIKGSKNVLLLIVSGKEEITIDEIGEINDYIQQEAGYSANIIMGVGEDENLDSGISVTIIATGFDVEQQNEITNIETKKIIHSLSDSQRVEQELSSKNTSTLVAPSLQAKTDKSLLSNGNTETSTQNHFVEKEAIIKHNLIESVEDAKPEEINLIPTTDHIKAIDVIDSEQVTFIPEEVAAEDFVVVNATSVEDSSILDINEIEVFDFEDVSMQVSALHKANTSVNSQHYAENINVVEEVEDRNQISLDFDSPQKNESADNYSTVASNEDVVVHQLEDSNDDILTAKSVNDDVEVAFELKNSKAPTAVVKQEEIKLKSAVDPINQPISESLRARVSERRAKMKEFNYKFKNTNSNIDEIEKQPAYKRAGVNLEQSEKGSNISRTSLSTDSNDELQIRKRNSFLHDNVD